MAQKDYEDLQETLDSAADSHEKVTNRLKTEHREEIDYLNQTHELAKTKL